MFSQPGVESPSPEQNDGESHVPVVPAPQPQSEPSDGLNDTERKLLIMAEKRRAKYVVLEKGGDAILLFGKHRGRKVSTLASISNGRDYLRWMVGQDFDIALMKVVRSWLARTV
jgi:hypothetical protein